MRTEGLLTGISVLAARLRIISGVAAVPAAAADSAGDRARLGGFYQAVVHKYYVDEIYAAVFVKPLIDGSTRILWHGIDRE